MGILSSELYRIRRSLMSNEEIEVFLVDLDDNWNGCGLGHSCGQTIFETTLHVYENSTCALNHRDAQPSSWRNISRSRNCWMQTITYFAVTGRHLWNVDFLLTELFCVFCTLWKRVWWKLSYSSNSTLNLEKKVFQMTKKHFKIRIRKTVFYTVNFEANIL